MFMDFNKHWLSSGLSTFNTRAEILTWIGLIQGLKDQRLYFSLCLNVFGGRQRGVLQSTTWMGDPHSLSSNWISSHIFTFYGNTQKVILSRSFNKPFDDILPTTLSIFILKCHLLLYSIYLITLLFLFFKWKFLKTHIFNRATKSYFFLKIFLLLMEVLKEFYNFLKYYNKVN